MLYALTRAVSPSLGRCELSFVERTAIDVELAEAQHAAYTKALESLGCRLIQLPAQPDLPDSVFVEDVAVVLDEIAVMTRPGAESRRPEGASVAEVLARFRPLRTIEEPGTIDGGDLLRVGRNLYLGRSGRSNAAAAEQLRELAGDYGYSVYTLPISGCLHLKSAVTRLDEETLLVQPRWIDPALLTGYRWIEVDPNEEHAANILAVGNGFVYPSCFPRTAEKLDQAGFSPTLVDVSELQKAEGAVTCCSLIFEAEESQPTLR